MKYEERLAVIYEPIGLKNGPLVVTALALVNYNKLLGSYTIKEGEYKSLTNKDFNIIRGNMSLMYGRGSKVYVDKKMKNDLFIYLFDNRDIKNIQDTLELDKFKTYKFIAKHVLLTVLIPYEQKMFNTSYRSKLGPSEICKINTVLYDDDTIYQQLYGKPLPEEKAENSNILVYTIDSDSGNFKKVSAGELTKAYPKEKEMAEDLEENINIVDSESKDMEKEIDIPAIIEEISAKFVGQDDAIKSIVSNIYYNQVFYI